MAGLPLTPMKHHPQVPDAVSYVDVRYAVTADLSLPWLHSD
jgi:hypothetical protein